MRNIRGENRLSTLSRAGYGGEPAEPLTISLEAACLATSRRPPQEIMSRGECHHMRWPTRADEQGAADSGRPHLHRLEPDPAGCPLARDAPAVVAHLQFEPVPDAQRHRAACAPACRTTFVSASSTMR